MGGGIPDRAEEDEYFLNDEQVMHAISLDDAYRVERVLAQGAGGLTELVTIGGAGPFVRKKIPVKLANRSVWSSIGELDCARLPKVEATYLLPDVFVVVYDYVPGQTLEELVAGRGRLDAATAAGLALDICEAAAALHSCGVIHRDLSPRNVIVAADGAHLIDLGIARMRVEGATRDTTFLGTRGFASPEQYGFAQTDARSDVYAIGRLLGFMLTGVEPDGENYEDLLSNADQVDAQLAVCVRRACAFEPSARYQSAEAMAAALRGPGGPTSAAGRVEAAAVAAPVVDDTAGEKKPAVKVLVAAVVALLSVVVVVAILMGNGAFGGSGAAGGGASTGATAATETTAATTSTTTTSTQGKSSGAASSTSVKSADELPLQIAESGWSADSQGYVHYAFCLLNTSQDTAVELPGVQIVGYTAAGDVLFTDERGPNVCPANQTTYVVGLAGGGEAPARVEFTLKANAATKTRQTTETVTFSASEVTVRKGDYGQVDFTGTFDIEGTQEDLDKLFKYASSTYIVVILRDEAGNIVYGENTVQYSLAIGNDQPYSIHASNVPVFATAEAHVTAD